ELARASRSRTRPHQPVTMRCPLLTLSMAGCLLNKKVLETTRWRPNMRVRFLGTDSQLGSSPTMFATDRGTLAVQGYVITDPRALADIGPIPEGETIVEIPRELLRFVEQPMDHDPRGNRSGSGEE